MRTNKLSGILLTGFLLAGTALQAQKSQEQDPLFEISKNLEIFNKLFKELNTYYVDPIQPGKVIKKGIDEMLNELDPYTNYITEEDVEDWKFQSTGKYGGIGCTFRLKDGYIMITEPLENSPVIKAGLKAGDMITEVNGRSIKGKSLDDLSIILKGSPGTSFKVKVKDAVTQSESVKTITREEIVLGALPYAGFVGPKKDMAYVRLIHFTDRCGNIVRNKLDSLKKANPETKGVILDLRYNPGGLLDEAVNLANIFIPSDQVVVTTKGKSEEWDKTYKTRGTPLDEKIPLVVMINRNSASASEIIAGTIQDLDRGVVVGQRSFGKGLVQSTRELAFNAKLKVTTAKYYTPSGRCIQAFDYSRRNEDGSAGEIPDSVKNKFKTRNGRMVMDGGGVDPDIKLPMPELSQVVQSLVQKQFIFDYATHYVAQHPQIAAAGDFSLGEADFTAFTQWLSGKDYGYQTKTEEALNRLKETAKKENYYQAIEKAIQDMQQSLSHDKTQDLQKNKKEILRQLQDEIVSRYYFQKGRYQNQLLDDTELKEAVAVLSDMPRYENILRGK